VGVGDWKKALVDGPGGFTTCDWIILMLANFDYARLLLNSSRVGSGPNPVFR
jgi:hypothetical protein